MEYNDSNLVNSPFDGYIQLKNEGVFVARVRLVYSAKGSKYRTSKTQKVSKGKTKKIVIPEGATAIFYYIEYINAKGKWIELTSDIHHEPTIICFKTSGTLLSPKCQEVECPSGDSGDDGVDPNEPCCKCCCCRCCLRRS